MYLEKFIDTPAKSTGWASMSEIGGSKGAVSGHWNEKHRFGGVVLYSNKGESVIADGGNECRHALIIGATGTGKSRLIIIPSLLYSLTAEEKRSYVIFDVKNELRPATLDTAVKMGYRVAHIDFRNPERSSAWNPLYRINKLYRDGSTAAVEKAAKLFENLVSTIFSDGRCTTLDPFWRITSAGLFRGICSYLRHFNQDLSFQKVMQVTSNLPSDPDDDYKCKFLRDLEKLPETRQLMNGFLSGSQKTRGNVLSAYYSYLSPITSRSDVLNMISADNSLDFHEIGRTPTVLYISMPDDSLALGALEGILLQQLVQELNDVALMSGGTLPVRTELYIDEMCNIHPPIPGMETQLTISRSRGMRYILAIQSYNQLVGLYGSAAESIASNCSTWIALNVAKDETFREKLSALAGENPLGRPLITPTQLSRLKYGEAVIIRESCAPFFTHLDDLSAVQAQMRTETAVKTAF